MRSAPSIAAVHWCWVNAHLYEEQTFIGCICSDRSLVSPQIRLSGQLGSVVSEAQQLVGLSSQSCSEVP